MSQQDISPRSTGFYWRRSFRSRDPDAKHVYYLDGTLPRDPLRDASVAICVIARFLHFTQGHSQDSSLCQIFSICPTGDSLQPSPLPRRLNGMDYGDMFLGPLSLSLGFTSGESQKEKRREEKSKVRVFFFPLASFPVRSRGLACVPRLEVLVCLRVTKSTQSSSPCS